LDSNTRVIGFWRAGCYYVVVIVVIVSGCASACYCLTVSHVLPLFQPWIVVVIVASSYRFTRFGTRYARWIVAQFNCKQILPYVAVNKDAFPSSPSVRRWLHQIIYPAKTSTGFSREFQAHIRLFVRFAVGSSAAFKSHRA